MEIMNPNISWPEWETVGLIGRGSFGAVYEIQRDVFGDIEKAALKVITIPQNISDIDEMYGEGYDNESITAAFHSHLKSIVAEYSLMRKMNGSANIVNCDDVRYVQHDDGIGWDIFIKMELLTPLLKTFPAPTSKETAAIPEETVMAVAKDICAALVLCKKHNIIHRDIKPQNIFLSDNGDYKLGDFGIAKTVEKTTGGTKTGTFKYMSPEVFFYKPYNATADIYSLGMVLYWMLNDRRMPFLPPYPVKLKFSDEEAAKDRRLAGEPLPPPAHGSKELKQIVLKACAFDPKDRYQSAREMLDALENMGKSTLTEDDAEDASDDDVTHMVQEEDIRKKEAEEQERLRREQEEQERLRKEQEEQERLQKEQEEQERLRKEQEEQERLRKEQEEQERLRKEQEEMERLFKEQERLKHEQELIRKEQEQLAQAKEELEQLRKEQEKKMLELKKTSDSSDYTPYYVFALIAFIISLLLILLPALTI